MGYNTHKRPPLAEREVVSGPGANQVLYKGARKVCSRDREGAHVIADRLLSEFVAGL